MSGIICPHHMPISSSLFPFRNCVHTNTPAGHIPNKYMCRTFVMKQYNIPFVFVSYSIIRHFFSRNYKQKKEQPKKRKERKMCKTLPNRKRSEEVTNTRTHAHTSRQTRHLFNVCFKERQTTLPFSKIDKSSIYKLPFHLLMIAQHQSHRTNTNTHTHTQHTQTHRRIVAHKSKYSRSMFVITYSIIYIINACIIAREKVQQVETANISARFPYKFVSIFYGNCAHLLADVHTALFGSFNFEHLLTVRAQQHMTIYAQQMCVWCVCLRVRYAVACFVLLLKYK